MFNWIKNLFRDRSPQLVIAKLSPAEEVLYYSDSKDPDNLPEPDYAYYCYGQKWATRFRSIAEAIAIGEREECETWGVFDVNLHSPERIKENLFIKLSIRASFLEGQPVFECPTIPRGVQQITLRDNTGTPRLIVTSTSNEWNGDPNIVDDSRCYPLQREEEWADDLSPIAFENWKREAAAKRQLAVTKMNKCPYFAHSTHLKCTANPTNENCLDCKEFDFSDRGTE